MNKIILFDLIKEITTKDSMGQIKTTKTYLSCLGKQKSIYQNEFYQADQSGIRPQGIIEMCSFDYEGEKLLQIDQKEYVIYRTYEIGTDKIELYYAEKVGNNNG